VFDWIFPSANFSGVDSIYLLTRLGALLIPGAASLTHLTRLTILLYFCAHERLFHHFIVLVAAYCIVRRRIIRSERMNRAIRRV